MSKANDGYRHCGRPGAGEYGEFMGKQTSSLFDPLRARVTEMVKTVPFSDRNATFNIGDYGTADGAASMTFIRDLILALKEHHGPEVQFQVIYEDLPTNDFNSLFKRLSGIISEPASYLQELDNVYPLASGITFHKQCVPTDSMHFIMSIAAVNWLSMKPVKFHHGVYMYPQSSVKEREILYNHAQNEWEAFLLMRSQELKQGGVLIVLTGCTFGDVSMDDCAFSLKTLISVLTDVWISFRDRGRINYEEFLNTNLPLFIYSLPQLRAPFYDTDSAVSKSGLRLLSSESVVAKCVFYSAWKEKKVQTGRDEREEFASKYVAAHRKWSEGTFFGGLSDSRTQEDKDNIVGDFYKTVEDKIMKMSPEKFASDMISCHLIIRKEVCL